MFLAKRESEPAPTATPVAPAPARTATPTVVGISRKPIEVAGEAPRPLAPPEAKRLIVGQGISLSGEITACDRLIVEGSVKVTLNETRAIEITETGRFTEGKAEVDEAEISGVYEGELTVRHRLLIRRSGRVRGTVRYGEIEVEKGGVVSGSISMLDKG